MAGSNRTSLVNKLHKVLRKHYAAVAPSGNRSVLEHLLFACCLEDAHYGPAEEAYARLADTFFDWNEIRVSSVKELSDVLRNLPDPPAAANRLKRVLQSVFESTYSFDLESLKKQNLGHAIARLEKLAGSSAFTVAYTTQTGLGGHAIALDSGTLSALKIVGLVRDGDKASATVPGLDRAIPKSKGAEFASLLHQLGADFVVSRYSPSLHKILLEIAPDAKERLPKKGKPSKKKQAPQAAPATAGGGKGGKPEAAPRKPALPAAKKGHPHKKPAPADKTAHHKRRALPTAKKVTSHRTKPKPR